MVRLASSILSVSLQIQVFQGQAMTSVTRHVTPSASFEYLLGWVTLSRNDTFPEITGRELQGSDQS